VQKQEWQQYSMMATMVAENFFKKRQPPLEPAFTRQRWQQKTAKIATGSAKSSNNLTQLQCKWMCG